VKEYKGKEEKKRIGRGINDWEEKIGGEEMRKEGLRYWDEEMNR
jgi:hypothetical protein